MAEWPTVAEVKTSLGIGNTEARDALIATALQAAIEQIGVDLGYLGVEVTEESGFSGFADAIPYVLTGKVYDVESETVGDPVIVEPSNSLATAALILATMAVKAPEAPYGIAAVFDAGALRVAANHPTYTRMLTGQRFRFGVA